MKTKLNAKKNEAKVKTFTGFFYDKKGNVHNVIYFDRPATQFGKIPDSVGFPRLR